MIVIKDFVNDMFPKRRIPDFKSQNTVEHSYIMNFKREDLRTLSYSTACILLYIYDKNLVDSEKEM